MIDPKTGEVCAAQLFVTTSRRRRASGTTSRRRRASGTTSRRRRASGTTGASNYTYAEATRTQSLPDWIASPARAFAFFGGVPAQVVPDNLKSGVTKACFYDPEINRTYADLGGRITTRRSPVGSNQWRLHWLTAGAASQAERVSHCAPLVQEQWRTPRSRSPSSWPSAGSSRSKTRLRHYGRRLRNRQFFCIEEVNAAIQPLLAALNDKVSRHLGASRRVLFEQLDQPALKPLPVAPCVYADWQAVSCRARLPCRHRQALLLGPPSADEEGAVGAS